MMINELILQKKITKYSLAKNCNIPYTTISDICNGKAQLIKCSAETIYKLAKGLNISMETLLEPYFAKRIGFELFKSNVCHRLKEIGDIEFVIKTLEEDQITVYYQYGWYPESLYLLAMLDYISRLNEIPICAKYNDLRHSKLAEVVYPTGVLTAAAVAEDEQIKYQALRETIPEFKRFNIVENEVRDVI